MPLDPMVAQLLEMGKGLPPVTAGTPQDARGRMTARVAILRDLAPKDVTATDLTIDGPGGALPLRLYRDEAVLGDLPVLVFLHGGGWVVGNLESHDNLCRALAKAGLLVVAVDYRLAPEARAPAQQEDAMAALHWTAATIAEHGGDPARISVGGDSAGGNLAALAAIRARHEGPKLASQLLIYPVCDTVGDLPSYAENADYGLSAADMQWFWDHWLGDSAACPLTAPLREPDLRGLPPAYVVTAEYDVLRDEGDAYAHRLEGAGVAVEHRAAAGMVHGFFSMTGLVPAATEAVAAAGRWVAAQRGVATQQA
ncbi:alpha/beta hydrolase [Sandaracinobacteroides saxicola]|uniref:Alpha/beta hydrolase n=1 Tax=Sandaracinobacteroides saxicola TaxID=2759707 RepID=A0A7G5IG24_9SPHN|nr:alpha/beta hydrolase [Sandaracinobacteroides saxicola]QMW22316.1 alpha/beta hydrolase [Sandaracinobacteroides saxicola]